MTELSLDEILEPVYGGSYDDDSVIKAKRQILEWHRTEMLKLIGENETEATFKVGGAGQENALFKNARRYGRNQLRKELRNKLSGGSND